MEVQYETLPGWNSDTSAARSFEELPENARKYVCFIEEHVGVPGMTTCTQPLIPRVQNNTLAAVICERRTGFKLFSFTGSSEINGQSTLTIQIQSAVYVFSHVVSHNLASWSACERACEVNADLCLSVSSVKWIGVGKSRESMIQLF